MDTIICYLCAPRVAVGHSQAGFGPPRSASERLGTLSAAHRLYSSRGAAYLASELMFDVKIITRRGEAQCVQAFHAAHRVKIAVA